MYVCLMYEKRDDREKGEKTVCTYIYYIWAAMTWRDIPSKSGNFFLSLKAYHGQVFDPSVKIFMFLSLSWRGDPKNVRHNTHFPYGGSGALGGLGWFLRYNF